MSDTDGMSLNDGGGVIEQLENSGMGIGVDRTGNYNNHDEYQGFEGDFTDNANISSDAVIKLKDKLREAQLRRAIKENGNKENVNKGTWSESELNSDRYTYTQTVNTQLNNIKQIIIKALENCGDPNQTQLLILNEIVHKLISILDTPMKLNADDREQEGKTGKLIEFSSIGLLNNIENVTMTLKFLVESIITKIENDHDQQSNNSNNITNQVEIINKVRVEITA
ncbi:unnamed protein product [[Candida] boidinii]|nr:unnamed protein product [[Candida] boidinii]